jgi:putative membrane protein
VTVAALAALAVAGYLAAARSVPRWPARRTACWIVGALLAGASALAPDDGLAAHMGQHAVMTMAAAPLLALGAPLALALRALPPRERRRTRGLLRGRAAAALAGPALPFGAFLAVSAAVHATPLLRLAERHPALHAAEHAALLASAVLFWIPALAPAPLPRRMGAGARILYLFAATSAHGLLAVWVIAELGAVPGTVMLAGMLPMVAAELAIGWSWARGEEARARRIERRLALGGEGAG